MEYHAAAEDDLIDLPKLLAARIAQERRQKLTMPSPKYEMKPLAMAFGKKDTNDQVICLRIAGILFSSS